MSTVLVPDHNKESKCKYRFATPLEKRAIRLIREMDKLYVGSRQSMDMGRKLDNFYKYIEQRRPKRKS